MPAHGEQHHSSGGRIITNPFEEQKPRISEYTAQEIATLQAKLAKQLGPEYISSRAGPGGGKVHYVAAEKCIQLANEVFGFNGWSSQIMDIQVDFVDENPTTFKVTLGLSVIVRVTLRDGTFHEDIGYGHIENCKGKAAAFEKAKKEGTTDGLKRALKNFGNVLGNCIYDKEYLAKVTKIKVQPGKWDVANLHRHTDHAIKREPEVQKYEEKNHERGQNCGNGASLSTEETFEDEFGEFDEADFSVDDPDAHPDEVVLPAPVTAPRHLEGGARQVHVTKGPSPNPNNPSVNRQQPMQPPNRGAGSANGGIPPQPQTPTSAFTRSNSIARQQVQEPGPPKPAQSASHVLPGGKVLNQPSRAGPPSAPQSPTRPDLSSSDDVGLPPQGSGFFSARAAARDPEGSITEPLPSHLNNLPAFNPHAESPSIKRTAGVDHNSSRPTTRGLKHIVTPSQTATPAAGQAVGPRGNIVNPTMDVTRRIGVPAPVGSPMANRGGYKPPTMKRPVDGTVVRTPLIDLPANGTLNQGDGGDVKRQKLSE